MAAGASVGLAAHLQWCLHQARRGEATAAAGVPSGWLSSADATVQVACEACMPLLNTAQELQSAAGVCNAFQLVQDASRFALPRATEGEARGFARAQPWVVGAEAAGEEARGAQQTMCAKAVHLGKVALMTMAASNDEAVRVAARNALQVRHRPRLQILVLRAGIC